MGGNVRGEFSGKNVYGGMSEGLCGEEFLKEKCVWY